MASCSIPKGHENHLGILLQGGDRTDHAGLSGDVGGIIVKIKYDVIDSMMNSSDFTGVIIVR